MYEKLLHEEIKTTHKIIIGDSRKMEEIDDESVHLVVTSPPYPMIEMWDNLFRKLDERIDETWKKMMIENKREKEGEICKRDIRTDA